MSSDSTRPLDDNDRRLLGLLSESLAGKDSSSFINLVMTSFGLDIVAIDRTIVGNNNSSFIVTVSRVTPSTTRVGYLAGTYPFPSITVDEQRRVVFTIAQVKEDMNAALMSANKVAAMKLIHDAGGYASTLTPHVYGWSDGQEPGVGFGMSWCLMEHMPGVVLSTLWSDLDEGQKLQAVRSMAHVIKSLQEVSIPASAARYGAFTFERPETESQVIVGETCFHFGGPFRHAVVHRVPRLKKWSGSSVTLRSGRQLDLSEALQELVAIVKEDGPKWREMTRGFESPPGLIHGDFNEMNFLVNPETLKFTALLDFEFAQSGPPVDEYFQSLLSQHMIYLGDRPSMSGKDGERIQALLLQGAQVPQDPDDTVKLAWAYIAAFKETGVYGPWSLNRDVLKRQAGLYWFGYELCNGPLQREAFWTSMEDRAVKRRERILKEVRANLEGDVLAWLD